jgi:small subunit ribosomal protein S2
MCVRASFLCYTFFLLTSREEFGYDCFTQNWKQGLFFYSIRMTLITDMLENAVHIGSKRQYWSPKMRNYVYGVQNGVHVFDLVKTSKKLEAMKAALADLSAKGKTVLIVGTKMQARELVAKFAQETNNYYIDSKWVPGLLTNFPTIKKRIATYNQIEKSASEGGFTGLTKKEISGKMKELEKLRKAYQGIKDIKRVPDALFVVDGHFEQLALSEARALKMPTYALLGSTGDIDQSTEFVPCNVNSIKSLGFVLNYLKDALRREKKAENPLKLDRMTPRVGDRVESEETEEMPA